MRKIVTVALIIICFLNARGGNNYYFSSVSGNDANTSTQAKNPNTAWRTLSKLNTYFSSLLPGDSVLLKRGETFYGSITISRSGTSLLPIVIGAYGTGAKPVISGLQNLTGWVQTAPNVWTSAANTALLSTVKIVLDDNVQLYIGRYPNADAPNAGYLTFESSTANSVTDNSLLNTPNWGGADITVRIINYRMETNRILTHAGTKVTTSTNFSGVPVAPAGYFFQNSLQTLDKQGEYYYNPTTKKLALYSTTAPSGIQASAISQLIKSVNFSYIHFDNLSLVGANDDAFNIGEGTSSGGAGAGIVIKNCAIRFTGADAFLMKNHSNLIVYNDSIRNSMNEGVFCTNCPSAIVRKNVIDSTYMIAGMGGTGSSGNGVRLPNSNNTFIDSNEITYSGYNAILFNGNNAKVRNNFINVYNPVKNDGGGIYNVPIGGVLNTGQEITNNIVLNGIGAQAGGQVPQSIQAYAIYLDNNSSNNLVQGNTCAYGDAGIFLHRGRNNIIRNNTIYGFVRQFLIVADDQASEPVTGLVIKNNIFFSKLTSQRTINVSTNASGYGSIDSNYYARPLEDNLSMRNISTDLNLAMWRTQYPAYDVHSAKSPRTITNVNQLSFLYNATASTTPVNLVGGWVDVTNTAYSGTISLQPYSSLVLISTGSLTTPTITWPNPAAITYGTALSGTQLNASTGVAGTFTYTPAIGTLLNAGTQTLSVLFTPTDQTTYSTASKSVTLVVNKAAATMSYSNLTQTYTGLPLAPTITTSPAGLTTINTLYNGVGATPISAGVYSIVSGLTNTNYAAPTISGTFTINKASATLTVSNIAQVYNGTQKSVTVVTSPVGLSGVSVTYNGSPTPPTNAGSYPVVVTLTNTNYAATTVNTTLVISKATPTVSWATPSAITYGTALSGAQLNATASVAGTFTYTPPSGTVLNAGSQALSVNFTPTDATNYNSVNNTTVNLVVNKAVATITITPSTLNQSFDGTPKSVMVTTSPANLVVLTITYNGSTTPPSAIGTYPVVVSLANSNYTATPASGNLVISSNAANIFITNLAQVYTGSPINVTVTSAYSYTLTYNGSATAPTNAGSYQAIATINDGIHTGADTQTLVISKATPVLTWSNPSDITFGTALSGTQLNATSNVAGTFVYSPVSGTVLNVGNNEILSTTFTPTDAANYNSVSKTVLINVIGNTATLSLSSTTYTYDGTAKSVVVTTNPVGLSGVVILYNGSSSPPTNAGTYTVNVSLANANYTATPIAGTLTINKANPVLSWNTPAPIPYGTMLSNIQLNATANIAGTFSYSPDFGSIPSTGTSFIIATFTPSDSVNYNQTSISVPISVIGSPVLNFFIRRGNIIYMELP